MKFSGFQKMTLLDYPGKVACTLFTGGCNMRCPFCHNASIVLNSNSEEVYQDSEILDYLRKRRGLLDGVCITGGEPLLHGELKDFIIKVKNLGFAVKLDTNGTFPERLKELVSDGLIDYVAMDIKNCKEKYALTVGINGFDIKNVEESVDFLLKNHTNYEFRTTVVKQFHELEDIERLAQWIAGAERYFLQGFVDSGNLIGGVELDAVDKDTLIIMKENASKYLSSVQIRGV